MKKRIKELEKLILKARNDYYNQTPIVSDKVFDTWFAELKELDPNNKAITSVGSPIIQSEWKKEKHLVQMGSLEKSSSAEEFLAWVKNKNISDGFLLLDKMDGLSINCVFENGF